MPSATSGDFDRRTFLDSLLMVGFVSTAAAMAYPMARYLVPPPSGEPETASVAAAKAADLPPNSGIVFKFGNRPGIVLRTPDGEVRALDSKFTVDDNALFRHPEISEMRDVEAGDPQERLAREKGVTYVKLDGEIGILGNGAGLVMSTLDVIAQVGGRPANFCDLGGGGDAEGVVDALEVIVSDAQVEAILFNIFGGITRCDEVARGILAALEQMTIEHPIVVRLDGTNAEEGRRLLADAAPPNVHVAETMLSAAEQVVSLA